MNSSEELINTIKRIESLEDSVREHIDTTRYQSDLLKDLDNWNQICSSLDTIGDTLYSIQDYLNSEYPDIVGLKYIYTYGILQALFIQQDAMDHLSEAFDIRLEQSDKLKRVRKIRNASIGHPTKNKVKGEIYYNYISRMTLSKYGFTLMRSFQQDRNEFIDIDLEAILHEQLQEIEIRYKLLSDKLAEADKMHKDKFRDRLLENMFHSSMGHLFGKVAEGIHSPSKGNINFGLSMLRSIQKTYNEFEQALVERNELNEDTKYDLDEYNHALNKLEGFLSGSDSALSERDARIYQFYIREQHKEFVQLAREIDAEYKEKATGMEK